MLCRPRRPAAEEFGELNPHGQSVYDQKREQSAMSASPHPRLAASPVTHP